MYKILKYLVLVLLSACIVAQVPYNVSNGTAGNLAITPGVAMGHQSNINITGITPFSQGYLVIGTSHSPVSLDWLTYPQTGLTLSPSIDIVIPVIADSNGHFTTPILVPNNPLFFGMYEELQVVWFDNNGWNVTNSEGVSIGGSNSISNSCSQWGITWTFDSDHVVGQYCNGDWWVMGPVNIIDITPRTTQINSRYINGSMINPPMSGVQGYDSNLYASYGAGMFQLGLNVAWGVGTTGWSLTVQNDSSLISVISLMSGSSNSASQLDTAAILTVVGSQPAVDAFRPPYTGNTKTPRHYESELDYSVIDHSNITTVSPISDTCTGGNYAIPSLSDMEILTQRVWLDHCDSWTSRYMHPVQNMHDYYRDFTTDEGITGLLLNCNFTTAQKRNLLVYFTQIGLDFYGNVVDGNSQRWEPNGHNNGRKFPILFAGKVLNDTNMLNEGIYHPTIYNGPNGVTIQGYSEDGQCFYVEETSPGVFNWGYGGYTLADVGVAEWGNFHTGPYNGISGDNVGWTSNPYRRCCSANGWVGTVLTMRMMGLQSAWNHDSFFDYTDRYMAMELTLSGQCGWTRTWHWFPGLMWDNYRPFF